MNLTLQPQASFTVVRQIANHTDSSTYYVQAVIRNAYTDAIIETLQLTSRGAQRFSKNWQVPADPSGQGFYISIVTSVYTDSGYTTKSENYGDEETTYLVQDRLIGIRGGGGGIDSYTVRRIIREELDKLPEPETFDYARIPTPKEFSDRTDEVLAAIANNRPEKVPPVDLSPVMAGFSDMKQAIDGKEVTPPTDLMGVETQIKRLDLTLRSFSQGIQGSLEDLSKDVVSTVGKATTEALSKTKLVSTFTNAPAQEEKPSPEEAGIPFDIKNLSL